MVKVAVLDIVAREGLIERDYLSKEPKVVRKKVRQLSEGKALKLWGRQVQMPRGMKCLGSLRESKRPGQLEGSHQGWD